MCAAMSPKERNISKLVAASMAFAIFLKKQVESKKFQIHKKKVKEAKSQLLSHLIYFSTGFLKIINSRTIF